MSNDYPEEFRELAAFNAAISTSTCHPAPEIHPDATVHYFTPPDYSRYSPEYVARMAEVQERFNAWSRQKMIDDAPPGSEIVDLPDGGYIIVPPGVRPCPGK